MFMIKKKLMKLTADYMLQNIIILKNLTVEIIKKKHRNMSGRKEHR